MRKLILTDYQVEMRLPDSGNPGQFLDAVLPYPFKDTLLNLMFMPALKLTGAELVKSNALALKIEASKDDEILLEDAEYDRVKLAIDTFKGYGRNDMELVNRITNAEIVK